MSIGRVLHEMSVEVQAGRSARLALHSRHTEPTPGAVDDPQPDGAADDPVANTELSFPDARAGGCHGEFDTLVNHANNLATASRTRVGLCHLRL